MTAEVRDRGTVWVSIADLRPADSPRLDGVDLAHALRLAEVPAELPPILVHRQSMRVIDGSHRVRAARHRGQERIEAVLVDCDPPEAFVLAVEANVAHGLPLNAADRRAAVARILTTHGHWSDRAIARTTGLSDKTVKAIRDRATADSPQSPVRIGRDGRARPLDASAGRQLASELIAARPEASLRAIAREVGISPGTVRDVKERLGRGEDPVLPPRGGVRVTAVVPRQAPEPADPADLLRRLSRDPSLRLNESGRSLLRWLHRQVGDMDCPSRVAAAVPSHCAGAVAELAQWMAESWTRIARDLQEAGRGD